MSNRRNHSLSYSGETVDIEVEIAMKDIAIDTFYTAKTFLFWFNGDGRIDMQDLVIRMYISCTNGELMLKSLQVVHLGNYSVPWITGWSYAFNWLLKITVNSIIQKLRQRIIRALKDGGEKTIKNILHPLSGNDLQNSQNNLRNMKVTGLSRLQSSGKYSLSYNGNIVNIKLSMPVNDIEFQTDYEMKRRFSWINGDGFFGIKNLTVTLSMSSTNGTASLHSIKAIHLGNYSVHLTRMNLAINRLLRIIDGCITYNSKQRVIDVLENVSASLLCNMVNPISLPDFQCTEFSLHNVKVNAPSNMDSHGNIYMSFNGETVNVSSEISVKYIKIHADYSAFTGISWISGDGVVQVGEITIRLNVSIMHGKARLNTFEIVRLGRYYVTEITGLSFLLNWLLKIIVNKRIKEEKQKIIEALEREGARTLRSIIEHYL